MPDASGTPAFRPRLVGDVGGTHARFALQREAGGALVDVHALRCIEHASFEAALRFYLRLAGEPGVREAAVGIANPVTGDRVHMTNLPWAFSIAATREAFGFDRFVVLNDFAALALALPSLPAADLRPIGGGLAAAGAPVGLIGPGTGLGVSGLFFAGRFALPIAGEGGHATLAAADDEEAAVLARLRERFGHASAERALSGPGLVNLHEAVCRLAGETPALLSAAGIGERAASGDARCAAAVGHFFSLLGGAAGNLALTLGARGGVYIGGGIVPKLGRAIDRSRFRERFEQKGRFADYLRQIPVWVVEAHESPALAGALRALDAPRH